MAEDPASLFYLAIPFIEVLSRRSLCKRDEGYRDVLHAEEEDLEESLPAAERQQSEHAHDYALDDPRNLLMLSFASWPRGEKAIRSLLRSKNSTWDGIYQQVCRRAGDAGQGEPGRGRRVR